MSDRVEYVFSFLTQKACQVINQLFLVCHGLLRSYDNTVVLSTVSADVEIIYTFELRVNNNPNLLKFSLSLSVIFVSKCWC